jgi:hypothetical protein
LSPNRRRFTRASVGEAALHFQTLFCVCK